jgi:hypothetical protein
LLSQDSNFKLAGIAVPKKEDLSGVSHFVKNCSGVFHNGFNPALKI